MASPAWLPLTLAVSAILIGFDQYPRRPRWWRRAVIVITAIVAMAGGIRGAQHISRMMRDLPEWDFLAFWIPARVAAQGGDFYDPATHRTVQPGAKYSAAFARQEIDVGFMYPPWTMLFLAPLGRLEARPAAVVWGLVHAAALAASIILLWRLFDPVPGRLGLLFTTALLLSLSPTMATLAYGQISFLLLLFLTLFWKERENWTAGLYLTLAAVTKPIGAFFFLQPVLKRSGRVLAAAMAALVLIIGLTILRFGWDLSWSYFTGNVGIRAPREVYVEGNRQSLLAAMLRLSDWSKVVALKNPVAYPPFVIAAALIISLSSWVALLLRTTQRDLALALLVPCGLLVYPATLTHYGVILILPLLYLWSTRQVHGNWVTILLISAVYGLTRMDGGHHSIFAYLLLWMGIAVLAVRQLRRMKPLLSRAETH